MVPISIKYLPILTVLDFKLGIDFCPGVNELREMRLSKRIVYSMTTNLGLEAKC